MASSSALRFIGLCAALAAAPVCLQAQVDPDSVRRRNDCRLEARVVETGGPAPREQVAWMRIAACDPELRAQVYLAAVRRVRQSTDREVIGRAVSRVVFFRDGRLLAEVLDIAGDRSATVPARVTAFMALSMIRSPGSAPIYEGFVGGLDEHGMPRRLCSTRTGHTSEPREGAEALPSDHLERIAALRERVRTDPTEPEAIRSAAAC